MRSIAIMNQKGGVGKTTTAVNLCAALAATGLRACLLDLDPQAHATLHFGIEPRPDQLSIYDVLTGKTRIGEVCQPVADNLWIIPSSLDLAAAELELVSVIGREVILRDKLRDDPPPVDYLLIDCPPSLGILTINALAAVSEVFIPLQPHFFALHGLSKLLETIDLVAARVNDKLKLSGVILCMYDGSTRLAVEVGQDVDDFFRNARGQDTPWAARKPFRRGFAATSAWPRRPASASRSFSTPPIHTAPRTITAWPKRLPTEGRETQATRRPAETRRTRNSNCPGLVFITSGNARGHLKAVVGDHDSFFGSLAIQPPALLRGIAVVLRHIGLNVQHGCAIQDVQLADVQDVAGDLQQPHRGQADRVRPRRGTGGEHAVRHRVPVGDHGQFRRVGAVTPEQYPDALKAVEILKSVAIRVEDFDLALAACRAERLHGRTRGTGEGGMNDANLHQLHDCSCVTAQTIRSSSPVFAAS